MATASEFRQVAAVLDGFGAELGELATDMRSLPHDGALTGPVLTAIDATVGVTLANLGVVVTTLDGLAAEARRRAIVCDAYTDAYRRFLRSDGPDRIAPRRPAPWVRHG